jgi:16S rRNA A1518/A1519 N6-dimethyltransferase RsmA/KsgA/DIM1 with predicted DNA glycosylase/AP lyase activity
MKELNFTLTIEQANVVMVALGKLPYEVSSGVIASMQQQANEAAQAHIALSKNVAD